MSIPSAIRGLSLVEDERAREGQRRWWWWWWCEGRRKARVWRKEWRRRRRAGSAIWSRMIGGLGG